jgi:hypothetical protein
MRATAGATEIIIDHDDFLPSQGACSIAERVLPPLTLPIILHLIHR